MDFGNVAGLHRGARRPRDGQLMGRPCAGYRTRGGGEGGHRGCRGEEDAGAKGARRRDVVDEVKFSRAKTRCDSRGC